MCARVSAEHNTKLRVLGIHVRERRTIFECDMLCMNRLHLGSQNLGLAEVLQTVVR